MVAVFFFMYAKAAGEDNDTAAIIVAGKTDENSITNHKSVTGKQKKGKKPTEKLKKEEEIRKLKKPWMIGLQHRHLMMIWVHTKISALWHVVFFVVNQGPLSGNSLIENMAVHIQPLFLPVQVNSNHYYGRFL